MTSPKAASKRAVLPRTSSMSNEFRKDYARLNESGRFNMNDLNSVMMDLIARKTLPPERKDHWLSGGWEGYRDCHVHGDFLLIYKLTGKGDKEEVAFARVGTHSEIFGR
jgi:mRNA interferase YafQ